MLCYSNKKLCYLYRQEEQLIMIKFQKVISIIHKRNGLKVICSYVFYLLFDCRLIELIELNRLRMY